MIRKRKITVILLAISLLLAAISLQNSGALGYGFLERQVTARTTDDDKGAIKLEGFRGVWPINLDSKLKKTGSITNNTNRTMDIKVKVTPNFNMVLLPLYRLDIKIGSSQLRFTRISNPTAELTVRVLPGKTVDVQASLINNLLGLVTISFEFTAEAIDKSFSIRMEDTHYTPRRIQCY